MKEKVVRSICGFCHSSCGLRIHLQDDGISRIDGDPDHPANRRYLCPKAQALKPLLESGDRLRFPQKKTKRGFAKISWDEALDLAANKLTKIREKYGPESLVHLSSTLDYGR
jgi:anaerobic selenocysteine-containing dehydrogenase